MNMKGYFIPLFIFAALFLNLFSSNLIAEVTSASVVSVIDGDTLKIRLQGREELVRLIGIDAPESHENDKATQQSIRLRIPIERILDLGKRSTDFARSVLKKNQRVELEFDVQKRDRFGRLLAYIYNQENQMLNRLLLKNGYAKLLTIAPNVKYSEKFRADFSEGRIAQRGLWSFSGFSDFSQEYKNPWREKK